MIPGVLAGMPMPFVHPLRRLNQGGSMAAYEDDLIKLRKAGVQAIVALLNLPSDRRVYAAAGFQFLCLPIADGQAPTPEQLHEFVRFVDGRRSEGVVTAVHCEAGIGRTGTMLAAYLIAQGHGFSSALELVRLAEPTAVETAVQIEFLRRLANALGRNSTGNPPTT
ncbi:MAG: dual specificity protein phosphatase family protein [Limisphaerales bacterium]